MFFCLVLICLMRSLLVPWVDSSMVRKPSCGPNVSNHRKKGEGLDLENKMFKPPSSPLLTVATRYFCCGSSMKHLVYVRVYVISSNMLT